MGLFNRQKTQSISDLENYYANRNNSTGKAWLMALLSLLITIAVLAALFFGARWVYRTLTSEETTVVTITQPERVNDPNITAVEPTGPTPQPASTETHTDTNHTAPTPASEPNGVVSDRAASTTTPSVSGSRTQATTTSRTGSELPETGAELNAVIVMLFVVTLTGYLVARNRFAKH